MKKLMLCVFLLAIPGAALADQPQQSTRCMSIEPICRPGQHPLCVCQSDYSSRCIWICVGR